ncbi:ThiF family adenylyltransferase [Actinoplanes sp. NPDC048796]|uniref:HesA/MoeB/ThiF family protein n=1 Tax=Actinoplanes sp. NPDC048796 TaxID=3155640 RepID=UPI00340E670E
MEPIALDAKLRVKPIYPVYSVTDRLFRIGAQRGITVDIDDPHGQMRALVDLLGGDRTIAAVLEQMRQRFPQLTDADMLEAIRQLAGRGLLEGAEPTPYETDPSLTRYLGNVNYFSHYATIAESRAAAQEKLRESKVVLFGLGGGGSYALPLLVAAGFGEIVAVDYDRVELSNLNRQLMYAEQDVGQFKADVAQRRMRQANSTVAVSTITKKIESARDVADIVGGADIAICAIDEPPFVAQRRVNAGCVSQGVPYVCGGSFVSRGRVFSVHPGESGCLDCLHIYYAGKDPLFASQLSAILDQDTGDVTIAFAPHIATVASFMVAEAVRMTTGHAPALSVGRQLELEYETGSWEHLWEWPRYGDECPTCGTGNPGDMFSMYEDVTASLRAATAGR